ncbi:MAG TPA: DNA polymerase Y family protein [Pirellulales bacterium]
MKRVLCVWLVDWPRQRRERSRRERTHSRGRLCHIKRNSRERLGHIAEREHELTDREALALLAAWCEPFSPAVGVESAEPPECLLLDVTGLEPLFHGEAALAEHVRREFMRRGFSVRIALADTIGAAWALAHVADVPQSRLSLRESSATFAERKATLAHSDFEGEAPALVVPPGQSLPALMSLPVETLRLSLDCLRTLRELGLRHVGQLLAFPRASLAARFAPELLLRLDQATGEVAEVIPVDHPPPAAQAAWTFESPTDRPEMLRHALQRQLEQVIAQLSPRRQGAQALHCRLLGQTGRNVELSIDLFRPSASPRHLGELAWMRLESAGQKLLEPIASLSLEVTATAPLEEHQQELFGASQADHGSRQLALLIDRLSNRLGRAAVGRPQLLPEAQPEFAWRYEALIGNVSPPVKKARSKKQRRVAALCRERTPCRSTAGRNDVDSRFPSGGSLRGCLSRPLSLANQPGPLRVMSVAPDGPPLRFFHAGIEHRIHRAWGPERIHTGWWRGRSARRDYYRVETTTGCWFWLFRQLTDGHWFLHGVFE